MLKILKYVLNLDVSVLLLLPALKPQNACMTRILLGDFQKYSKYIF